MTGKRESELLKRNGTLIVVSAGLFKRNGIYGCRRVCSPNYPSSWRKCLSIAAPDVAGPFFRLLIGALTVSDRSAKCINVYRAYPSCKLTVLLRKKKKKNVNVSFACKQYKKKKKKSTVTNYDCCSSRPTKQDAHNSYKLTTPHTQSLQNHKNAHTNPTSSKHFIIRTQKHASPSPPGDDETVGAVVVPVDELVADADTDEDAVVGKGGGGPRVNPGPATPPALPSVRRRPR